MPTKTSHISYGLPQQPYPLWGKTVFKIRMSTANSSVTAKDTCMAIVTYKDKEEERLSVVRPHNLEMD